MKKILVLFTALFLFIGSACGKVEPTALSELNTRFFRVPYYSEDGAKSVFFYQYLDSAADASEFLSQYGEKYDLYSSSEDSGSFSDAISSYTDEFFSGQSLLVFQLIEGSGSTRHEIVSASADSGSLNIAVRRISPEIGTTDMASWFALAEVPKEVSGLPVGVKFEQ